MKQKHKSQLELEIANISYLIVTKLRLKIEGFLF